MFPQDTEQLHQAAAPEQPCGHEFKLLIQLLIQPSGPIQLLFTVSTVFNKLYEIFNTLL